MLVLDTVWVWGVMCEWAMEYQRLVLPVDMTWDPVGGLKLGMVWVACHPHVQLEWVEVLVLDMVWGLDDL